MACTHFISSQQILKSPTASSKVYKEECTLCFDHQDLPQGILVCLTCFNGSCWKNESNHSELHFQKFKHPFYLNIRRIENEEKKSRPEKMTKLEIIDQDESKRYSFVTDVICAQCGFDSVKEPSVEISNVVQGVMSALSAKKQSEIQSWQEESLKPCRHTDTLSQCEPMELQGKSLGTCCDCGLAENLWLCLTCGNLGCGRAQYGGIGGNGHALNHFNVHHHPLSVKMGSITPEGTADVFCYEDGDEIIDPLLGQHLANFGINILSQQKTEKSIAELQLEQNLKFDFSMTTADGKQLEPLFGRGLTGLKNLGNSCYMAAVLQIVFSIPAFVQRYIDGAKDHVTQCCDTAAECFSCQMFKIADGLVSGRYSVTDAHATLSDDSPRGQEGIMPLMFKSMIGKGHQEFSTMRQQDAQEFLSHLLTKIEQKERTSGQDPSKVFACHTKQRLQCLDCERVGYKKEVSNSFIIPVPKLADGDSGVTLEQLLKTTFEPYFGEYNCPIDKKRTTASFKTGFASFPKILAFTLAKFVVNDRWVWEKLVTNVELPTILSLDNFVMPEESANEVFFPSEEVSGPSVDQDALNQLLSMGFPETRCVRALLQTGNNGAEIAMNWLFEHMDDPDIDTPLPVGSGPAQPTSADISQLTEMGFSVDQARKALKETDNNMERAVDWLFSHAGSMDTDSSTEIQSADELDTQPKTYELFGFISHKGTSAHCGHYVAHIKKENHWVLFNDNKVVAVPNIQSQMKDAYICFYRRIILNEK